MHIYNSWKTSSKNDQLVTDFRKQQLSIENSHWDTIFFQLKAEGLSDLLRNFAVLCTTNIHLFDFFSRKMLSVES